MKFFKKQKRRKPQYVIHSHGICPVCEESTEFASEHEWLRDHFICTQCGSVPRERALMQVIKMYYPNYSDLRVHESSPSDRGASWHLRGHCKGYSKSFFYPDLEPGEYHSESKEQCQNLESMTFEDESFDLFITQDVMEHVFNPQKAFSEIARVLKPGGAHIFTVPIVNKEKPTEVWATKDINGNVIHHHEPEFHGNPIDDEGILVTMHWGYDIAEYIASRCHVPTTIVVIDDLSHGIRAEYIEVLVSRRVSASDT